jgi:hypothetical protein
MEMIEIISKCDFYDNDGYRDKWYSGDSSHIQKSLKLKIKNWMVNTSGLPETKKVTYFLDSLKYMYRPYFNTSKNLLFLKDSSSAKSYILKYYQRTKGLEAGKLLLSVGENCVVVDCLELIKSATEITDDRFTRSVVECINIVMEEGRANEIDFHFSHTIAQGLDPSVNHAVENSQKFWQSLVYYIPSFIKPLPGTLKQLLKIETKVAELPESLNSFLNRNFGNDINIDFRVCDFALLMYSRRVQQLELNNWDSTDERDQVIRKLLER